MDIILHVHTRCLWWVRSSAGVCTSINSSVWLMGDILMMIKFHHTKIANYFTLVKCPIWGQGLSIFVCVRVCVHAHTQGTCISNQLQMFRSVYRILGQYQQHLRKWRDQISQKRCYSLFCHCASPHKPSSGLKDCRCTKANLNTNKDKIQTYE